MTVLPEKEPDRRASCPDHEKLWGCEPGEARGGYREAMAAADQTEFGSGSRPIVHHQVRRIREEDLRIWEAVGEGLSARDRVALVHLGSGVGAILCSRPSIFRCSPLGNKAVS